MVGERGRGQGLLQKAVRRRQEKWEPAETRWSEETSTLVPCCYNIKIEVLSFLPLCFLCYSSTALLSFAAVFFSPFVLVLQASLGRAVRVLPRASKQGLDNETHLFNRPTTLTFSSRCFALSS